MVGRTVHELFPGASLERWADTCRRVMRERAPETTEGYFEALGKWFEARLDATDDGLAIFIRDIGDRKRAELRQQFMMRELDHRVKNNLAAVLAITESSLRESEALADFSEPFVGRIRAIASMHSLPAARRWEGVG